MHPIMTQHLAEVRLAQLHRDAEHARLVKLAMGPRARRTWNVRRLAGLIPTIRFQRSARTRIARPAAAAR